MVGKGGSPFGVRLRQLREAAGLTQEALAEAAGLSVQAIGALERGDRRRPHPHTLRALGRALGLTESASADLVSVARRPESWQAAASAARSLPRPATALVGRAQELADIAARITDPAVRLLTITGPGGVGKTRLAIAAAWRVAEAFADGVAFVPLAPLTDAGLVTATIAQALGLQETGGQTSETLLRGYLRERRLLLILDNVEHVLDAAVEIAGLLDACPGLVILATSRAPLRLRGESEYAVGPLSLPDRRRLPALADVEASEAAQLFMERARASAPWFQLTEATAGVVAGICERLDGLPLALELAAARIKVLDPHDLLIRLDHALPLLSRGARDLPYRQQTMHCAIRWSFDLLSEREQALFLRLSVFAGGWDLAAAEAVGTGPMLPAAYVVDTLLGLVEQSLVVAMPGEGQRYRMLEPIRQYALERLREHDAEAAARRRHAEHFYALARAIEPELKGPGQVDRLAQLEREHDNLRTALAWLTQQGDLERLARMSFALWLFWWTRGHFSEGQRWVGAALADDVSASPAARAWALVTAGLLAYGRGDYAWAARAVGASLPLFEQIGDAEGHPTAIGMVGLIAIGRGDYEAGAAAIEDAVRRNLAAGNRWNASMLLTYSAAIPLARGEYARAGQLSREGLALAREMGDRIGIHVALYSLARIAHARGDDAEAEGLYGEALDLSLEMQNHGYGAYCLEGLAGIAAAAGEWERAATLWGAAEALLEDVEAAVYVHAPDRAELAAAVEAARAPQNRADWEAAWAAGRDLSLAEAVAFARGGAGSRDSRG